MPRLSTSLDPTRQADTGEADRHHRVSVPSITERRIEREVGGLEIDVLAELGGFLGAGFAVHAAVFPFHRERRVAAVAAESSERSRQADGSVLLLSSANPVDETLHHRVSAHRAGGSASPRPQPPIWF